MPMTSLGTCGDEHETAPLPHIDRLRQGDSLVRETCAALRELCISIGLARAECLRRRKSLSYTLGTFIDEHLEFVQFKVRELSAVVESRAYADRGASPINASAVRYVTALNDAYEDLLSGFRRLTMPTTNPASIALKNSAR